MTNLEKRIIKQLINICKITKQPLNKIYDIYSESMNRKDKREIIKTNHWTTIYKYAELQRESIIQTARYIRRYKK